MNKKIKPFPILFLLFTIIPLAEVYLLFQIAQVTNWVTTMILVIVTGMVGAYLAKSEGHQILSRIQQEMAPGHMPGDQLISGLCVLIGGVLLVCPGILTDLVGLTLVLGFTRKYYKRFIIAKLKTMMDQGSIQFFHY